MPTPEKSPREIRGLVLDTNGRGLPSLTVRVFERRPDGGDTLVGETTTTPNGTYQVEYFPTRPPNAPQPPPPQPLLARAFAPDDLLLAESPVVPATGSATTIDLLVDEARRTVRGTIRSDAGHPLPEMLVLAFDRDLRHEEPLGQALTDASGRYQIGYTPKQFHRAEKATADLLVRAFLPNGTDALTSSPTLFNAPQHAIVDLQITAAQLLTSSEWERYEQELVPLLENVPYHELTDDDLEFLHPETGIDQQHLRFIRSDAQWRYDHANAKIPAATFYGLLRQGLPPSLGSLLRAGRSRWHQALKVALADRQVPASLGPILDEIADILTNLAIDQSFVEPKDETTPTAPGVGTLLAGSDVAPEQQRQIVAVLLEQDPDSDPLEHWKALAAAGVPDDAIRSTRFALETSAVVRGHLPTLRALQGSFAKGFGEAMDLARLNRTQWAEVATTVAAQGPGALPKDFETAQAYAEALADDVERVFPTPVVAHRLREDDDPIRRDVGELLLRSPAVDLLRSTADDVLANADLSGISTPIEPLTMQLHRELSVARLAPSSNRAFYMSALLQQGYDSATKIVLGGKGSFRRTMLPIAGPARTNEIAKRADAQASKVVLRMTQLYDNFDIPSPVLPHVAPAAGSHLATWVELFGGGSACRCPHCESFHGPAAYLADLLAFLGKMAARPTDDGDEETYLADVLRRRRLDLWHLKLDCPNAEVPLPYIDLVNELLERLVLGLEATAENTPQTPADTEAAARLRAEPDERYTLGEVYQAAGPLQSVAYPWSLPFDRNARRAEIDLSLIGTSRAELLARVHAPEVELARAHLGLTEATWTRLSGIRASGTEVAHAWGLDSLDGLERMDRLHARSGIELTELYAMIESPVFAEWRLFVDRSADPCDITRHHLRRREESTDATTDLDEETRTAVLDLMHRALRLRLELGWSVETLLEVMRALGVGHASPELPLVAVGRIVALAERLELTPLSLARRMVALAEAPPDSGRARQARESWLAWLGLSPAEHADLVALGMPDGLAELSGPERLARLEAALDDVALVRRARLDPAELRFLLTDVDVIPAVFALAPEDLEARLDAIVEAIPLAEPDSAPMSVDERQALLERQAAAIGTRLQEVTGSDLAVAVAVGDVAVGRETSALLSATAPDRTGDAMEDFLALAEAGHAATEDMRARTRDTLLRVIKVCRLLDLLHFDARDVVALGALARDAEAPVWPDLDQLPPGPAAGAMRLDDVRALLTVSVVQAELPEGAERLLVLIERLDDPARAPDELERLTSWGRPLTNATVDVGGAPLQALAASLGLDPALLRTWQDPQTYARLRAAARWLQGLRLLADRHGAGADRSNDLAVLLAAANGTSDLAALRDLARLRFASDHAWYQALTPAMDRLRAQQRDALIDYLLHHDLDDDGTRRWTSVDTLSDHLLIDVQMSPCQLTSRIVLAHSVVQRFVQRCLLNLETDQEVAFGEVSSIAQWRQWDWMKNYRVWEAARKVFLYPENWIEPDLRIAKSPFFADLENELLQGEITPELAEGAVRSYLTKLHEVAQLDIRALYEETVRETGGDGESVEHRVIHMVGRTRREPHVHYYRQRRMDTLEWTPWEKIEIGIDTDHVALVVHHRRPMVLWPQWSEAHDDDGASTERMDEMRLSVLVRELDRWAQFTLSTDSPIRLQPGAFGRAGVLLKPNVDASTGGLIVDIHRGMPTVYSGGDFAGQRSAFGEAVVRLSFDTCTGQISSEELSPERRATLLFPLDVRSRNHGLEEDRHGPTMISLQRFQGGSLPRDAGATRNRFSDAELGWTSVAVFQEPAESFRIIPTLQYQQIAFGQPWVLQYQGQQILAVRTSDYFDLRLGILGFGVPVMRRRYVLESADHAFACDLLKAVYDEGLRGLYDPARRVRSAEETVPVRIIEALQPNTTYIAPPFPADELGFSVQGPYALYNWELFFHVPLLIADRLGKSGRFEDAHRWFHAIFDPTDVSVHGAPQKYWRVRPLFEEAQRWGGAPAETLEAMLRRLSRNSTAFTAQLDAWRNDPFDPHRLASMRLVAYMKTVVQKYVENLLAWGDSLFRRDTMESINEAMQLYAIAHHILGEGPVMLPPASRDASSYDELVSSGRLDEVANALLPLEASLPGDDAPVLEVERPGPGVQALYFCIPSNPRLHELRATVADRLFKIRHCMDIDGRVRQLALFAPPIDPALLVRARAAGLDIGRALELALTPTPHYRFQPLLHKALELCGEVRSFGAALLSALEKRDGEQLAQLRARHEVTTLELATQIRKQQIEEAKKALESTRAARRIAEERLRFYSTREIIAEEENQQRSLSEAHNDNKMAEDFSLAASIVHALPDWTIGTNSGVTWGGSNIGHALSAVGQYMRSMGSQHTYDAEQSALAASRRRRQDDWDLQAELAQRELAQLDQQIAAAEIRLAITERELSNHQRQIEQSREVEAFLRDKLTNAQLYAWMSAQLAALHYQAYRMAFELARQAEAAADFELPTLTDSFIQLDHWDGSRKGLLAGERLAQDLRRLELEYMRHNQRRLELTTHVSLRRLDARALFRLRGAGSCAFELPAWVLDQDFPGLGNRRIKSVSVSVPGVVGPYVGVHGILRLSTSDPDRVIAAERRLIATSSGQGDAGLFQLDLRDERYLPFEGQSLDANTTWSFQLPQAHHPFDYDTISDLVLHIQYTADEVGIPLEIEAPEPDLEGNFYYQAISVRHDFPAMSRQLSEGIVTEATVELEDRLFPYFAAGRRSNMALLRPTEEGTFEEVQNGITDASPPASPWERIRLVGPADANAYLVVRYTLSPRQDRT